MKLKSFALVFLALLISAAASAQEYSIRVTYNTNLRATYSLKGRIVETALAGAVLPVFGSYGRWLKINRNGRDLWMADWVPHSRVAGSQPPANIDNCCFVDRQCVSDQEWRQGYWAYQRAECPLSAALTGQHVNRGHAVTIDGSPPFIAELNDALDMMRERSPKWYQYVVDATDRIFENPNDHVASAFTHSRSISIRPHNHPWWRYHPTPEQRLISLAAYLLHEACHIHRHHAGHPYNAYTKVSEEVFCIALEPDLYREIDPYNIATEHAVVGPSHCEGSLENHPACARWS